MRLNKNNKRDKLQTALKLCWKRRYSMAKTARTVGISWGMVSHHWNAMRLEPHYAKRQRLADSVIKRIYELHDANANTVEIAKELEISNSVVNLYLATAGKKPSESYKGNKIGAQTRDLLAEAYYSGLPTRAAAEYAGVSQWTSRKYFNVLKSQSL